MERSVYRIEADGTRTPVDFANTPFDAQRAMLIASATEVVNGRTAHITIEHPIFVLGGIEQYDLPAWVLEVLQKEGM